MHIGCRLVLAILCCSRFPGPVQANLERTISAAMLADSAAMVQALTACQTQAGIYSAADGVRNHPNLTPTPNANANPK